MRIRIVCIGKLKERYWSEAVEEYSKRLSRYCELEIVQLKEARLPDKASLADEQNVIFEEGQSILKNIKEGSQVITLEIKGKELSSEGLSAYLGELQLEVIINDLRKRLPDLNLVVSPPIINIREACALLPAVLRRGTVRYPDLGALSARLDRLYGASVDYTVRKQGENQCVGFVASFIDDSFIPGGEQLLEPVAELVGELLCDPVTERGRFVGAYFESEKANLADAIRSVVNDKREYADYYRLVFDKVRVGGLIVADDVLWDGKVVAEGGKVDAQTRGILAFNDLVQADRRVENLLLPIRHGLMLVRKVSD